MQKTDSISLTTRKPVQHTRQLTYNEERAAELYGRDRQEKLCVGNVPFKGQWQTGRI